jgi:23S rRNA (pseudouridine1915-N3)-methyltransferase
MKLRFIWIGKTRDVRIRHMLADYLSRIEKFARVEVTELRDHGPAGAPSKKLDKEGQYILSHIGPQEAVIALDERGRQLDSIGFAELIEKHRLSGTKELTFVAGSHLGLSDAVKNRAQLVLSLSRMTLTHEMARLLLIEQVYRAFTIIHDLPYQK